MTSLNVTCCPSLLSSIVKAAAGAFEDGVVSTWVLRSPSDCFEGPMLVEDDEGIEASLRSALVADVDVQKQSFCEHLDSI